MTTLQRIAVVGHVKNYDSYATKIIVVHRQVQQAGVGSRLWRYLLAAAATDDQRGVGQRQRAAQAGTACPGQIGQASAAQIKTIVARVAADQAAER